jgi:hypothetical protein
MQNDEGCVRRINFVQYHLSNEHFIIVVSWYLYVFLTQVLSYCATCRKNSNIVSKLFKLVVTLQTVKLKYNKPLLSHI